jgi:hypothetical protein
MWVKDNPGHHTEHYSARSPYTVNGQDWQDYYDTIPGGLSGTSLVIDQTVADTRARYLRFFAVAVALITLASIPLLRQREQQKH